MSGNDLTKTLQVYFDEVVEGFDASVVLARQASQYSPRAVDMSRANNTFWRPQPVQLQMQSGWDTTGKDAQALQKLSVPATINQYGNIEIALNLQELQDPTNMSSAVRAAHQQINATLDMSVADVVSRSGSLVVTGVGPMNWDLASDADTMMTEQGITIGAARSLFLAPTHYSKLASVLAGKQNQVGAVSTAWEQAKLPVDVAGFRTFKTDYTGYIAAGSGGTLQLTADVAYTPKAMQEDAMGGGESPVDNRKSTLGYTIVSGVGLKVGDAFTIDGVYAVHHVKKNKTPRLKTFRVLEVNGTTVTYTPALIPSGPYQNVSAKGAAGAKITVLNTVSESPSIFWREDSVEIIKGNFDGLQQLAAGGGARFMKSTTKGLGFPIAMLYWLDAKGVVYNVKWLVFYGVNNLNPEMNGITLANQVRYTEAPMTLSGTHQNSAPADTNTGEQLPAPNPDGGAGGTDIPPPEGNGGAGDDGNPPPEGNGGAVSEKKK